MKVLSPVIVLTSYQLDKLARLVNSTKEHPLDLKSLIEDFAAAKVQIWKTEQGGLVLTEVADYRVFSSLYVIGIVGRDILRQAEAIFQDLQEIKTTYGCRRIEGETSRRGLKAVFEKLGMTPHSVRYVKED
jgi:hypothetical protein